MSSEKLGPGKTLSFRLPHDTPEDVINYLNRLKKAEGRKFSSKIAPKFVDAVHKEIKEKKKTKEYALPLPKDLSESQITWLNNPHTKELITQMIVKLATDPGEALNVFNKPAESNQSSEESNDTNSFKANDITASFMDQAFFGDLDDD